MKPLKKLTTQAVILGLCVSSLAVSPSDAKASRPKLSKKNVTITKGKTKKIKLSRAGKSAKVTWKASKKKIIKLTKKKKTYCNVKGLKKGTASLICKAKVDKKTYTLKCKVKVVNPKPTPSIKDTYKDIVPYMGAAVNYGRYQKRELRKASTLSFIKKHFNSITLENEMKPDNILGSSPTLLTVAAAKAKGYYIPADYKEKTVPALNFKELDGALSVAAKNGLKMRAHTLVWHSQTPQWFFTKDYDYDTLVTTGTMDARLDYYIHNVMGHVMKKEKSLTGSSGSIVYAWDVVNEYLHRFSFGKTWDKVYGNKGASPLYVKKAFELAYDMLKQYGVEEKVTLFYNDYNTYFGVQETLDLVNFINKDEPAKICGGIGMQSHVDVKVPTVKEYGDALETFLASGYEIQITELDFTINFDTKGSNPSYAYKDEKETDADQELFVKKLMETIIKKQKNRDKTINPKGITSITLWGLCDSTSWRSTCEPLLFAENITEPKASFFAFINAAKVWNK